MARPSEKTIKTLFARSGNRCAFTDCASPIIEETGSIIGEICHIKANKIGGPRYDDDQTEDDRQAYDNLILLCRCHHKIADDQTDIHTVELLREMKRIHESEFGRMERAQDTLFAKMLLNDAIKILVSNNSGNVAINSPGVVQGRVVHVSTNSGSISVTPPPGTIGTDQQLSRYVQYLIGRYNEFASVDHTRATKFSYGALSKNVEHKFGAQWKLLAAERFDPLCAYLQERIRRTRVGKANAAKGWPAYSTFREFLEK